MNINELAKNLCDRAVALELITWLRENELLADNSGDITTDTQLAEHFAFFGQEENEILAQVHRLLVGST
jgi:phage antirepressor YoqD-like protein